MYSPSVTVTDTGNATTPGATGSSDTQSVINGKLNVDAQVVVTNPPLGATWPDGVSNRSYGSGSTCSGGTCTAPLYNVSGGLGGYVWPATTPGTFPAGFNCPGVGTGSTSYSCSANPITVIVSTRTAYSPSVTATDTPNLTTPLANTTTDPGSVYSASVYVDPQIDLAVNLGATWPNGVVNRSFGQGNGCTGGACTAAVYTTTYGLADGYNYTESGFPVGFTYTPSGTGNSMLTASAPSNAITKSGPFSPTVTATDTPNATTPAATVTTDPNSKLSSSLAINAALALGATEPPTTLPTGVNSRDYGVSTDKCAGGAPCAPVTYTLMDGTGLPPYIWPSTLSGAPAGFGCTATGPDNSTNNCSAAPIAGNSGTYQPVTTSVTDTANASVPSVTLTDKTTPALADSSLTVNGALALGSTEPPTTLATGVTQRDYGVSTDTCSSGEGKPAKSGKAGHPLAPTGCQPITYTVEDSTGLPPYTWPSTLSGAPTGFACTATGTDNSTNNCSAAPITGNSGTYQPITTSVTDTANTSAPSGMLTDTTTPALPDSTLTVNGVLATVINLGGTWPDAVQTRPYGDATLSNCSYNGGSSNGSSPCMEPDYTATGGLPASAPPAYNWPSGTPSSFPLGFSCGVNSSGTDYLCDAPPSGGVSGGAASYMPSVTVADNANTSAPAGSQTTKVNLTVDNEIVIANTQNLSSPYPISNGQLSEPYSVPFGPVLSQGGTPPANGGGTGNPGNANAQYTWTNDTGLAGVTFPTSPSNTVPQPGSLAFAGLPTTTGLQTVHVSLTDDGNTTTPPCSALASCTATNGNVPFTADIFSSIAYVDATNNAILPVDTSQSPPAVGLPIKPAGGLTPIRPSVSPNGRDLFVADDNSHFVYIIDTQTNKVVASVSGLGLASKTGDTADVAVGPQTAPPSPPGKFDPDSVYAYVANAAADNVQVIDGDPNNTSTFGTVVKTITLQNSESPGAEHLKVSPTILENGTRYTDLYVVRPGGYEVCVIDAEPTSSTFLTQIVLQPPVGNTDGCIALNVSGSVLPKYINITPDGLFAFVSESDGSSKGQVDVIDVEPGSATQYMVIASINTSKASPACNVPEDIGETTDWNGGSSHLIGQTTWVACSDSNEVVLIQEVLPATAPPTFTVLTTIAANTGDQAPKDIAFKPDGTLALVTISGSNTLTPINPVTGAVGTDIKTTGVVVPTGIDHIPNASLHALTSVLPNATSGYAYESSVVAGGGTKAYTFVDVNGGLAALGLTLSPDGKITSSGVTGAAGNYQVTIQVTDSATPKPNVLQQVVSLTIN